MKFPFPSGGLPCSLRLGVSHKLPLRFENRRNTKRILAKKSENFSWLWCRLLRLFRMVGNMTPVRYCAFAIFLALHLTAGEGFRTTPSVLETESNNGRLLLQAAAPPMPNIMKLPTPAAPTDYKNPASSAFTQAENPTCKTAGRKANQTTINPWAIPSLVLKKNPPPGLLNSNPPGYNDVSVRPLAQTGVLVFFFLASFGFFWLLLAYFWLYITACP